MSAVEWKEPPADARGRGQGVRTEAAKALRSRPGEWALLSMYSSPSSAVNIRRGSISDWQPAGAFEATTRRRPDGKHDVYARYVGEVQA